MFVTTINNRLKKTMKTFNMSNTPPPPPSPRAPLERWNLVRFHRFSIFSDNMTALGYAFIVFSKRNDHSLVYIHCLYSHILSSFFIIFYIEWTCTLQYQFKGRFRVPIKFDPCLGLRIWINISYCENIPRWIKEVPRDLKTQEMCDETVGFEPRSLAFVSDCFKTRDMCSEAVGRDAYTLAYVPDNLKTQKICNEAIRKNPAAFFLVPDCFKRQEMCNDAVDVDPWTLYDVPDHFKTQKMCDNVVQR